MCNTTGSKGNLRIGGFADVDRAGIRPAHPTNPRRLTGRFCRTREPSRTRSARPMSLDGRRRLTPTASWAPSARAARTEVAGRQMAHRARSH